MFKKVYIYIVPRPLPPPKKLQKNLNYFTVIAHMDKKEKREEIVVHPELCAYQGPNEVLKQQQQQQHTHTHTHTHPNPRNQSATATPGLNHTANTWDRRGLMLFTHPCNACRR